MKDVEWFSGAFRCAATITAFILLLSGCTVGPLTFGPGMQGGGTRQAGTLLYADPQVIVRRANQVFSPTEQGMQLLTGDIIDTQDGQAVIDYENESRVMLNRSTRVQLGSISLFLGELFAKLRNVVTQEGGGRVVTKEAVASVEGTDFDVQRSARQPETAPGNVSIFVRRGRVLCSPAGSGKWTPVLLPENFALTVNGYATPAVPHKVDAAAQSAWADDAEMRLWRPRPVILPAVPDDFGVMRSSTAPYIQQAHPRPLPSPLPAATLPKENAPVPASPSTATTPPRTTPPTPAKVSQPAPASSPVSVPAPSSPSSSPSSTAAPNQPSRNSRSNGSELQDFGTFSPPAQPVTPK